MEKTGLIELIETISNRKYETQTEECKASKGGCPEHLYDTFSSFSNQDEGAMNINC